MRISVIFLIFLIVLIIVGCQGTGPVVERLDAGTGSTVATIAEPMVFARTLAKYSRSARDYLYLGPVELNRQGSREYFLWVGAGTTLDRGYLAPAPDLPQSLLLSVRGEIMVLDLVPWQECIPGLADPVVYDPTVKVFASLGARVSRQQLDLIGAESLESVRVADASGEVESYPRWRVPPAWDALVTARP